MPLTAQEAAKKWNISQRRVSVYCTEGRIPGAVMFGKMWAIPDDAEKPTDGRKFRYASNISLDIKPFVKWAGGKGQLLNEIRAKYPKDMGTAITKYAEPFVGGGAVLFDILKNYEMKQLYISDINAELINAYRIIRDDVISLVSTLKGLQDEYVNKDDEDRKSYYYSKRDSFNFLKVNGSKAVNLEKAALFIFLNKTCFNGLYRVNSKGLFNVPMGAYKNPLICDEKNLKGISDSLKNVTIICGDYKESASFIDKNTFVYFDPPYRPLTSTSSFTSYTEALFNDEKQQELAEFVTDMSKKGAKIVVSNSDPKNINPNDNFFEALYSSYYINYVEATRMINSNSEMRGKISELLISTY